MMDTIRNTSRRGAWAVVCAMLALAAGPLTELVITGQILYGRAEGAEIAAVTDIVTVYENNPAFIRMREAGLSETDGGRGQQLFDAAQAAAKKALAGIARDRDIDVITTPGGVSGSDAPIDDVTQEVIDRLPLFHVEGKVLQGRDRGAQILGEVDSQLVLESIPEYVEWVTLGEDDARYHLLRKHWQDAFNRVVRDVWRNNSADCVVELGGATSRLGSVPDWTQQAIDAL